MNRPDRSSPAKGPHFSSKFQPRNWHLQRCESLLQSAKDAAACDAGAMYLLDDASSQLNLYLSTGELALREQLSPHRPLAISVADLEALCGHAVVLEQPNYADLWNAPISEVCGICVPVSSRTTIWGTLWLFAKAAQAFSDEVLYQVEVVANQLAEEWECELVVQQFRSAKRRLENNIAKPAN